MKTPNLIVRIPEACHEDWNKMTPDDKGRFCGSCQKSVFDFSNKTDDEIKEILLHYKDQKICGHFKKTQVNRPLQLRVNLNDIPRNMSISRTFALALFLAFGSVLFSCTDHQNKLLGELEIKTEQLAQQLTAELQAAVTGTNPVNKNVSCNNIKGDVAVEQFIEGEIDIRHEQPVQQEEMLMGKPSFVADKEDSSIYYVKGKVKPVTEENNAISNNNVLQKEVTEQITEQKLPVNDSIIEEQYFLGGLIAIEEIPEKIEEPVNTFTVIEEKAEDPVQVIENTSAFSIYPNPGKGEFTIKYNLEKKADIRIDLLDASGRWMSNIVDVSSQYEGKYQIPVSVDIPNGIYFICLVNNGKKELKRLVIQK